MHPGHKRKVPVPPMPIAFSDHHFLGVDEPLLTYQGPSRLQKSVQRGVEASDMQKATVKALKVPSSPLLDPSPVHFKNQGGLYRFLEILEGWSLSQKVSFKSLSVRSGSPNDLTNLSVTGPIQICVNCVQEGSLLPPRF